MHGYLIYTGPIISSVVVLLYIWWIILIERGNSDIDMGTATRLVPQKQKVPSVERGGVSSGEKKLNLTTWVTKIAPIVAW